ncbi:30S ribosome-binding factor RbfA [Mycoplasmopsis lipofaciens]|uniref:30S ribosome-binding factor RbfA n=1 Tax=Mycoplasmopsis lipofaciens TaxID=114884 RepID=UPI0004893012|nr:30S ribosome-binding factor RbfA [Mycoplasmopsis lipofaciens]
MKKSINTLRRESQIRDLIADIVTNDITNSNVINPTIVDCVLSGDLSHVKVFVTFTSKQQKGLEALCNAAGFVKKMLSKSLNWRKVPEIHFYLDDVTDNGMKIDSLLNKIKNNN